MAQKKVLSVCTWSMHSLNHFTMHAHNDGSSSLLCLHDSHTLMACTYTKCDSLQAYYPLDRPQWSVRQTLHPSHTVHDPHHVHPLTRNDSWRPLVSVWLGLQPWIHSLWTPQNWAHGKDGISEPRFMVKTGCFHGKHGILGHGKDGIITYNHNEILVSL